MTGFGLYPLANEGASIHPDVSVARPELLSDDEYQKMLSAYHDYYLLHYRSSWELLNESDFIQQEDM